MALPQTRHARDSGEVGEELQVAPARGECRDGFRLTEPQFERQNAARFENAIRFRDQALVNLCSGFAAVECEGGFPVADFALQ